MAAGYNLGAEIVDYMRISGYVRELNFSLHISLCLIAGSARYMDFGNLLSLQSGFICNSDYICGSEL